MSAAVNRVAFLFYWIGLTLKKIVTTRGPLIYLVLIHLGMVLVSIHTGDWSVLAFYWVGFFSASVFFGILYIALNWNKTGLTDWRWSLLGMPINEDDLN